MEARGAETSEALGLNLNSRDALTRCKNQLGDAVDELCSVVGRLAGI